MTKNKLLTRYEETTSEITRTKWAMCRAIKKYGFYSPGMDKWLEEVETTTYRIARALLLRYGHDTKFTFTLT